MALPKFKTKDEIPEAFRDEYTEVSGEWIAKSDSELEVEKRKKAELLDEKKKEAQQRKAAEDELATLKREKEAKDKNIPAEELQRLRDEDEKKRKPLEEKIAEYEAKVRALMLTDKVKSALRAAGVEEDRIDDAMLIIEKEKRVDIGDKDELVVNGKDGKVTTDTLESFATKTFAEERPWLYKGRGSKGAGTGNTEPPPAAERPIEVNHNAARSAF